MQADFSITDCPPGDNNDGLRDYRYDARFLGVSRYQDDISIQLLEYPVLTEETDGLSIKLRITELVEQGTLLAGPDDKRYQLAAPLTLPLALDGLGARASLSMFQTCPDFPTVHAVSGTLRLDRLSLAVDPEDTGHDERVEGTLTASIARGSPMQMVGDLRSDFGFDVPRRPLMTFQ